jgi:putative spermidine/putrescine transport system ATP-binding protein
VPTLFDNCRKKQKYVVTHGRSGKLMHGADIEIEDLRAAYGDQHVLHGIDLSIAAGEFVALLGSSGCGKTTLLRCLSGFIKPVGGKIIVNGNDVTALSPEKRDMAMVFQSYALWPHMSVNQNIGYGLKLRQWSKTEVATKVDGLIEMLGLEGFGERKTDQLSGGQRQRVALGRALAIDPPVLLLDEPLSNLDARIRLTMRHEIRMLQKRLGITAVHVTHDREEAMVMADRIVILDQGRVAQVGTPAEVYQRPASSFVAAFMGAENHVGLQARASNDHIVIKTPDEEYALPRSNQLGDIGVHWVGGEQQPNTFTARFRSDEAALAPNGNIPDDHLGLPGIVRQASYPGGCHRYAIESCGNLLMIDDSNIYREGADVMIAVPASSLHIFPPDDTKPA